MQTQTLTSLLQQDSIIVKKTLESHHILVTIPHFLATEAEKMKKRAGTEARRRGFLYFKKVGLTTPVNIGEQILFRLRV